jgi:predicted glutamine amidotransferase
MAIDEDIYTAKNGTITKFRKGEKVSFSQNSDIKNAFIIYTTEDTKFMWILDKENKKLFKTKKSTGEKLNEYTHEKFSNTQTLSVDEENNTATISTPDEILSFELSS